MPLTLILNYDTPRLFAAAPSSSAPLAAYSSGNRNAEVLAKLKASWRDDALVDSHLRQHSGSRRRDGYLSERGVSNIVVTGQRIKAQSNKQGGDGRRVYGSNKHLAGLSSPCQTKKAHRIHSSHFQEAKKSGG